MTSEVLGAVYRPQPAPLRRVVLLDSFAKEACDRVLRLAVRLLHVPVALISLVDEERQVQVFKSWVGLPEPWASQREHPLDHSLCQYVRASGQPLLVADARQHALLGQLASVLSIGAYAGIPLSSSAGEIIGTLCVIDRQQRAWSEDDLAVLQDLAALTIDELELRMCIQQSDREQREKLASLERISEAFFALDTDWRFSYFNGIAEQMLWQLTGKRADQIIGENVWQLFPEAVGSRFHQEYQRAVDEQVSVAFEAPYAPLNSWFEVRAYPSRDGLSVYVQDITERKREEQELARYREIIAHSSEAIAIIDREARYIRQNAAHRALLGFDDEELQGQTPALHMGDATFARVAEALDSTGEFLGEITSRTKSGTLREIELAAFTLRSEAGEPLCYVGFKRDVTERKRAEVALRQRFEQLQLIYQLSDAISRAEALEEIYELALKGLQRALQADRAAVLLYDPDGVMRFKAWHGLSETYRRAVEGHSPWAPDHPNPQPIVCPDIAEDAALAPFRAVVSREGICALSFIPLLFQGRVLGKFMIYYNQPHQFSDEELQIAQTIASHIAFATERRRAQEELRARARQQAAVAELGQRALAGRELALLMEEAVLLVRRTLEVEYSAVLELQPDGEQLRLCAGSGWPDGSVNQLRIRLGGLAPAGPPHAEGPMSPAPAPPLDGIASSMSVIIYAPGAAEPRPFGMLAVYTTTPRHFMLNDINFLQAIANVLSTTLERKQIEQSLQFHNSLLAAQSEASIDGILVVSGPDQILSYNRRFIEMWQIPEEVISSRSDEAALRSVQDKLAAPEEFLNRVAYLYQHPDEKSYDEILLRDGRIFERYSAPLKGTTSDYYGRVWFTRDVTERRRNEEAQRFLAEASAVLASSLDIETTMGTLAGLAVPSLADWCIIDMAEEDGSIHQMAATHRDPSKFERVRELRRCFPPDDQHAIRQVLRSGQSELASLITPEQLAARAHNAEHLALLQELNIGSHMVVPLVARGRTLGAISFVAGDSGRHYDTTDLALAEELARRAAMAIDNGRLYQEMQQALQARDQFLSVAAHELRTPITALLSYAQLLQRRNERHGTANAREQQLLDALANQTRRLNRLSVSLLELSRIHSGTFSIIRGPLDIGALGARVAEELQTTLERHTLEFEGPAEPLIIEGDELRLEQVLQNLLQNAVKYSPDGGLIRLSIKPHADAVYLIISDQGIGIPARALPRLFTRFYRAGNVDARQISGMGLGLYVVKEIVSLHGGSIEVESQEGQGSTFRVRLPQR